MTDSSRQIVEQYQYSPYGLLLSGDSSKTLFLFNGMYGVMTDSNNLYYMRARFYNPEIKRFINQDILLGGIGEGQTLNRYAFVTGRPVSFVDPFGFKGREPIGVDFNKDFWDKGSIRTETNCYGYALNRPGYYGNPGNIVYNPPFSIPSCPELMDNARRKDGAIDPKKEGTCGGECPGGYYKIQIFFALPNWLRLKTDYHVYRQDKAGSWSHKRGRGGYITQETSCPISLGKDYTPFDGLNYTDYCGTLCVEYSEIGVHWWNAM